jgi:hypothetical protein
MAHFTTHNITYRTRSRRISGSMTLQICSLFRTLLAPPRYRERSCKVLEDRTLALRTSHGGGGGGATVAAFNPLLAVDFQAESRC